MPQVRRTNPDKVLWPDENITKAEFLAYLEGVGEPLLEEVRDRPLTLVRAPDGINGFTFFQKQTPRYAPDWLDTVSLPAPSSPRRTVRYFVCNTLDALLWAGNQAALELHPALAQVRTLTKPDVLAFDLDPPTGRFDLAVAASRVLHEALDELELRAVVKTTGGKGLHVFVPIVPAHPFDEVEQVAKTIALRAIEQEPKLLTLEFRKRDRRGRVLVDIGRNSGGATIVAAFSPRARPGAPVSFPVAWNDLETLDPSSYTIRTVSTADKAGVRAWREARREPQRLPAAIVRASRASG